MQCHCHTRDTFVGCGCGFGYSCGWHALGPFPIPLYIISGRTYVYTICKIITITFLSLIFATDVQIANELAIVVYLPRTVNSYYNAKRRMFSILDCCGMYNMTNTPNRALVHGILENGGHAAPDPGICYGGGGGGGGFTRGAAMYAKLFERGGGAVGKLNEPIHHSHARILY